MVFPSLAFHVEPGTISQFSALAVIGFSFLIHRWKKIAVFLGIFFVGVLLFNQNARAFMAVPSNYYGQQFPQTYQNNYNYYGQPWGYAPPMYFYPQLQYHSLWGPTQPNYFNPHPYSPYAPQMNCPYCQQMQQQQYQPQFPPYYIHPGGGAS